jgi:hypothetical protein
MPDISMCTNEECPLKETCYRYNATPSEFMQAYAKFEYDKDTKSCDYYWKNVKDGKDNTRV